MKEQKVVYVFSAEQYDGTFPPDGLLAFRDWLNAQIEAIPEPYRASAVIDIDNSSFYDSTYATVDITYTRPMTDAEIAAETARRTAGMEAVEARQRAMYEELKRKFA